MSTADDYIAASGAHREALERLRELIREAAPGADESIRVGLPAFHHRGRAWRASAAPRATSRDT